MDKKETTSAKQAYPIFNDKYDIMSSLGDGKTSKVYLVRSRENPDKKFALKLLRDEFLNKDNKNVKAVEREIQILQGLSHKGIVSIVDYGSEGIVKKKSGR